MVAALHWSRSPFALGVHLIRKRKGATPQMLSRPEWCQSTRTGLFFVAFQRRAKNVAQRCARIGRAILCNGIFFFGDFTRLDR